MLAVMLSMGTRFLGTGDLLRGACPGTEDWRFDESSLRGSGRAFLEDAGIELTSFEGASGAWWEGS